MMRTRSFAFDAAALLLIAAIALIFRSEGKRLGRPPIAPALEARIRKALAIPGCRWSGFFVVHRLSMQATSFLASAGTWR